MGQESRYIKKRRAKGGRYYLVYRVTLGWGGLGGDGGEEESGEQHRSLDPSVFSKQASRRERHPHGPCPMQAGCGGCWEGERGRACDPGRISQSSWSVARESTRKGADGQPEEALVPCPWLPLPSRIQCGRQNLPGLPRPPRFNRVESKSGGGPWPPGSSVVSQPVRGPSLSRGSYPRDRHGWRSKVWEGWTPAPGPCSACPPLPRPARRAPCFPPAGHSWAPPGPLLRGLRRYLRRSGPRVHERRSLLCGCRMSAMPNWDISLLSRIVKSRRCPAEHAG